MFLNPPIPEPHVHAVLSSTNPFKEALKTPKVQNPQVKIVLLPLGQETSNSKTLKTLLQAVPKMPRMLKHKPDKA